MIKYDKDTRYGKNIVVTHNGIQVDAIPCHVLADVDHLVTKYDVICLLLGYK